ncbi:aldehyde dehydrogenase family protein [Nocardioides sp. zg-1228]|uniref:aldehyde dehydrogenase family protein n=1 Tax=Nocardioides sp. zg-1228 TaxID=2763008 RepID=UPI0016430936|nr:aldehyde dehydrogenase family protein [Nocardioides sp. zg-1228]MBC2932577.1 aldehyde dehydrogenase family protein [Nocardioides sp. zg-1228]QSF58074.1 aldehyde dehydrogenase family protein [Nocardioides sp. zg-1228]
MSKHARARGLPIDGTERPTGQGWAFPVRSPATGEPLWDVPDAGVVDARAAVSAARRAVDATQWGGDADLRAEAVRRFAAAVAEHADALVALMAAETGVPVGLRDAHLDAALATMASRRPQPAATAGVTAVVTPATSPLAVAVAEVGRVLAAGGAVVLKPAAEAASAAIELGRIGLDVLPRGVLNVVTTRDVDVAIALTLDDRVDEVSLTGSAVVAERVHQAGQRAGKRLHLDVGGPQSVRVGDDADLQDVVARAASTVAANAGQGCRLPASVVVPAHRHAEALQVAVEAMRAVAVGDPSDPATVCGPLRSAAARDRVRRYLDLARSEGGDVALGGQPLDRPGWWFAPTVVGGLSPGSRLVREEVLGPVLMVAAAPAPSPPSSSARA